MNSYNEIQIKISTKLIYIKSENNNVYMYEFCVYINVPIVESIFQNFLRVI